MAELQKRIFETRIRTEKRSKVSEIVVATLTSREKSETPPPDIGNSSQHCKTVKLSEKVATTLNFKKKTNKQKRKSNENRTKIKQQSNEKRIFETRIRLEKQSKLREIVAPSLTSR